MKLFFCIAAFDDAFTKYYRMCSPLLPFPPSPLYPSIPSRSSWLEVIHKNKENGDKCKKKRIPARLTFIAKQLPSFLVQKVLPKKMFFFSAGFLVKKKCKESAIWVSNL